MRKRMWLGILALLLTAASILGIYYTFYYIDLRPLKEGFTAGIYASPDDVYELRAEIWRTEDPARTIEYEMGLLVRKTYLSANHTLVSDANSRIVYWNERQRTDDDAPPAMDVMWLDGHTLRVDGREIDVRWQSYDYRRSR